MSKEKYVLHSSPGHGWLEVMYSELLYLGIASEISGFSYRVGNRCYLEEDCDASIFIDSKERVGEEFDSRSIIYDDDPPFVESEAHYYV